MDLRALLSRALLWGGCAVYRLDVFGKYKWLSAAERWSPAKREQWRVDRLGNILEFAWTSIPFYREFWGDHGLKFERPRSLEALQGFPILTKQLLRENAERMRPPNLHQIRHKRKSTGGSTSVPVNYLLDFEQWSLMEAYRLWGWERTGYRLGEAVGVIAGGSLLPAKSTFKSRARSFAQRRLFLYGVAMDAHLARDYHQRLLLHKAVVLYGYPSVLYLFAKHLHEQGLALPGIKAAITTAEMLQPQYREGIERWIGCPVFNNLGSNDGGFESYECSRHQGFHYDDLQSILEVHGASGPESSGPLLITNLWNRSTPFIRYENGDRITLADEKCPCGSSFPLIGSIEGRTADILTFACGRSLSGPALTLIFGDMPIDGWQIVQTGANHVEVRLCSSTTVPAKYTDEIQKIMNFHLNGEVAVSVRQVESLQLTRGGKLKPIWKESDQ